MSIFSSKILTFFIFCVINWCGSFGKGFYGKEKCMNPYLVIILADVLLATTFVFQKKYQQKVGTALRASLWYTILTALCSVVFLFVLNGFTIRVSGPSLLLAVLMALASTIYGLIGFRIMEKGSLGVYMLFLMSGGMAIPYFYGIWFLGETPSLVSTIAFSLIIASTFISNISKDKVEKKQLLLCIIVFFLNGIVSTVGKSIRCILSVSGLLLLILPF